MKSFLFLLAALLTGGPLVADMWHDYAKLRLVCFWKISATEAEASKPVFPAANRRDIPYQYQEIMKNADISAHLAFKISPAIELSVQSLLQDDGQDLALITTRLARLDTGAGFGDNHDVPRNASGMNVLPINKAGQTSFVSYACGAYDLPLPAAPRVLTPARHPPIH